MTPTAGLPDRREATMTVLRTLQRIQIALRHGWPAQKVRNKIAKLARIFSYRQNCTTPNNLEAVELLQSKQHTVPRKHDGVWIVQKAGKTGDCLSKL